MKNTGVILCGALACGLVVGCASEKGPQTPTTVLQEDEVKVKVDAEGRPQVGSDSAAGETSGAASK